MNSCLQESDFEVLFEEAVPMAERSRIHRHLEQCPACREEVERREREKLGAAGSSVAAELPGQPPQGGSSAPDCGLEEPAKPVGDEIPDIGNPDFRIVRRLPNDSGVGGQAVVYEGYQTSVNRKVAIKVFDQSAQRCRPDMVGSFSREAERAGNLNHSGIVHIYASGQHGGLAWIAMEWIGGSTLAELIGLFAQHGAHDLGGAEFHHFMQDRVYGCLGPETSSTLLSVESNYYRQVAGWIRDAAYALAEAHRQGLIHRDVKPSNLMLDDRGRLVVTDFGLARKTNPAATQTVVGFAGSVAYASPEQIECRPDLDHRTDIFSLGATMYELLTYQRAFPGAEDTSVAGLVLQCQPVRPVNLLAAVPQDLEDICLKAMSRSPRDRYEGCMEFGDALQGWLRAEEARASVPPIPAEAKQSENLQASARPVRVAAGERPGGFYKVLAAAILLAGLGWWAWPQGSAAETSSPASQPAVAAPTQLAVKSVGNNWVALIWAAPASGGRIKAYEVRRDGTVVGSTQGTSYTDQGLTADASFGYEVRARDEDSRYSDWSGRLEVRTLGVSHAGKPGELPPVSPPPPDPVLNQPAKVLVVVLESLNYPRQKAVAGGFCERELQRLLREAGADVPGELQDPPESVEELAKLAKSRRYDVIILGAATAAPSMPLPEAVTAANNWHRNFFIRIIDTHSGAEIDSVDARDPLQPDPVRVWGRYVDPQKYFPETIQEAAGKTVQKLNKHYQVGKPRPFGRK